MTSLPDRPDLDQLRTQAKELKRALAADEQDALDRVLAWHPKFAGRPAERAEEWTFTLRDAQVTIARELGFESWKDLLDRLGSGVRRWSSRSEGGLFGRAAREAADLKHGYVGFDHLMLAILKPPELTPASETLSELGLTYEEELARVKASNRRSRRRGQRVNPALQSLLGWSQGIAIGMGSADLRDEHVLLAMMYYSDLDRLSFFVDHDEVLDGLNRRGVPIPAVLPPVPGTPTGPYGPFVYLRWEQLSIVTKEMATRFPPGSSALWGMNKSKWKRDHWYIHGEDGIPIEEIVRSTLPEEADIEVLSNDEGIKLENVTAPRRYRDRPKKESS